MSDTKITAKIDADISQLKSGMREAAESLKKAALNMRSSISQVSDSLDRATKDASKMREEFDRMLKLNQAPSGGFISNLTSSLGIANSSMKDLLSKMTGIGSQADLIIKSFESIKALAEYAIEEMWVRPLKDAAEVAERNARSIKEASDMNREYRDSTTALMREYGQLNEAEAMSNVPSPGTDQPLAPTVTVTKVGSTTTITASDINGTTSATIEDGDPNDWIVPDTTN